MSIRPDPSMQSAPEIGAGAVTLLNIGNDEALLSYRSQVLVQAGFQVVSIRPKHHEEQQFSSYCFLHGPALAIACHTLTAEQRVHLAGELRRAAPRIKLLALTNDALTSQESSGYDRILNSLDGPAALIEQIRAQLGPQGSSAGRGRPSAARMDAWQFAKSGPSGT